ncbi:MAG: FHA domain-containing protein [Thiohalomonas sp.]|nr:FHA domain-containing protein [Thiohalomonas sp.]
MTASQVSLLFKDRILSIHPLDQHNSFVIGNSPDCQIQIDSLAVSPRHAKITFTDQTYFIEELENESDILINNKKIDSSEHLSDADRITLGKHTLVFSFDERNERHEQREPDFVPITNNGIGWIQYLNGRDMGKTTQIKKNMSNISDDKENNIAMISNPSDGFYISYLKGKKPPMVNNVSIGEKSTRLANNSRISLASQEIRFYIN